jgi:hypothetical protein
MSISKLRLFGSVITFGLLAAASGCAKEKPAKTSGDWLDSLEKKKVTGKVPDVGDDDDDDAAEKPKEEPKEAPKPAPVIKKSSGRPMIQMGPSAEIKSTFGATPGSLLKLKAAGGNITLKIPEFSLDAGYNIEFTIDTKTKVKGTAVGSIAKLKLTPGDKMRARAVPTRKDNYEVRLPLHDHASVNLAVGSVSTDKQGVEQGSPTWKVYAPTKVETAFKEAHFSIAEIGPVMWLYATTAEVTEGG